MRLEKGYRDWGHDIDNTDDPFSTGLGFAVRLDKTGDFIGKQASIARKAAGSFPRRLVQILLEDPEPLMFHSVVVLRDGVPVGEVRAASYGHTLGGEVGLAMVVPKLGNMMLNAMLTRRAVLRFASTACSSQDGNSTSMPSATTMALSTSMPRAMIRAPREIRCISMQ